MISRMDQQKGIDLALDVLRKLTSPKFQAIILGSGDPQLEQIAYLLETKFPRKIRTIVRFDSGLAHRMYAAGDILLMPSRYEPCGLSQMIAMRYGCIPVARSTGGLLDSIQNTTARKNGTGFLFEKKTSLDLAECLLVALQTYKDPVRWHQLQRKAMRQDFSWDKSAFEYYRQYCQLMEEEP
jgi:starch synthase